MRLFLPRRLSAFALRGARRAVLAGMWALAGLVSEAAAQGFDAGHTAAKLVEDSVLPAEMAGSWLRIRGVPDPATVEAVEVAQQRAGFLALRRQGHRTCVMLRPATTSWATGVRGHPYARLPLDLREAFAWMQRLQAAYGDLVDRWEIDNEPDIGFVPENPENYAAYLKACALGAATPTQVNGDGIAVIGAQQSWEPERGGAGVGGAFTHAGLGLAVSAPAKGDGVGVIGGQTTEARASTQPTLGRTGAQVLMAPLALPPGPYLEAFIANDGLSYTAGFNYHYYGYAEDFSGVYRQFERAVGAGMPVRGDRLTVNGEGVGGPLAGASIDLACASAPPKSATGANPACASARPRQPITDNRLRITADHGPLPIYREERILKGWTWQRLVGGARSAEQNAGSEARGAEARASSPPTAEVTESEDVLPTIHAKDSKTELASSDNSVFSALKKWLGSKRPAPRAELPSVPAGYVRRTLPVFLTECGFAMLDKDARNTVEGRVRQWAWFRDVGAQIRELRIEGPMAFYLPPYLEYNAKEYGLTMEQVVEPRIDANEREAGTAKARASSQPTGGGRPKTEDGERRTENGGPGARASSRPTASTSHLDLQAYRAGGVTFSPGDFGATRAEPWMARIGQKIGPWEASPALAWLLADAAKPPKPSRGWTVTTPQPSPVVIDFVAGPGVQPTKAGMGYTLVNPQPGTGELRIYNFGPTPVSGTLDLGEGATADGERSREITLVAGELRRIAVQLRTPSLGMQTNPWRVSFAGEAGAPSVFQSRLYASPAPGTRGVWKTLTPAEAGPDNTARLERRPLAISEPPETVRGGWSMTRGVTVTGGAGEWTFTIAQLPAEATRPAIIELILPDGYALPPNRFLDIDYRVLPASDPKAGATTQTLVTQSDVLRNQFGVAWRTANGNLYTVWRPAPATPAWQRWAQRNESYTMAYYGRADLPWRFFDNRPVSLVFTLLPGELPATLQVRRLEIVQYGNQ